MPDRSFLDWPFFDDEHRRLADELEAWAAAREEDLAAHSADVDSDTRRLVKSLGEAGWLRHAVVAPHGGASPSLDVRSLCLVRETLARRSGLADFAFAMQGLGTGPLSLFGTEPQKERYLGGVATGARIAAFAISEQNAGSDVAAMETTATLDGDAYVLDGSKTWISNAGIADHYVVFARTGEAPGTRGITAFVVDADQPGLSVSERIDTIAPHPLGTLRFDACRVPRDQVVGEPGQGFKIAMATLDVFRSSVGAAALGFARRALDEALARSQERIILGKPLFEQQMIQGKLANMAVDVDGAALLVYRAAWTKDVRGGRVTREAAMAKLFATERAQRVVDQAVQIFGGLGVVTGNAVEQLYREVRALRIYEGTSEIQRIVIARQALEASRENG